MNLLFKVNLEGGWIQFTLKFQLTKSMPSSNLRSPVEIESSWICRNLVIHQLHNSFAWWLYHTASPHPFLHLWMVVKCTLTSVIAFCLSQFFWWVVGAQGQNHRGGRGYPATGVVLAQTDHGTIVNSSLVKHNCKAKYCIFRYQHSLAGCLVRKCI